MPRRTLRYRCYAYFKRSIRIVTFLALALFMGGVYIAFQNQDSEVIELSDSLRKILPQSELSFDVEKSPPSPQKYEEELDDDIDILSLKQSENDPMGNPIILWWTPFTGEIGSNRKCGAGTCFFTQVRESASEKLGYLEEKNPKVLTVLCFIPVITVILINIQIQMTGVRRHHACRSSIMVVQLLLSCLKRIVSPVLSSTKVFIHINRFHSDKSMLNTEPPLTLNPTLTPT